MIGIKLMGGLGNQMFQFAAARGLAKRFSVGVGLDLSWYKYNTVIDTPRHYELDCFTFKPHFLTISQVPLDRGLFYYQGGKGKWRFRYHRVINSSKLKLYAEKGLGYNQAFSKLPDQTFLFGWWQTEKYFANAQAEIIQDFQYRNAPNKQSKVILERIGQTCSVSLHVRRGDYADDKATNKTHGLKGLDYYNQAVKIIAKKLKQPTFFVISDDPTWCKKNLKLPYTTVYISHNTSGEEDMHLMRSCQHNIIANSSFSWWGAWLNENPKKIVIAPKMWFNDPSLSPKDILPASWQKI